ncbi:acyl carrier protein [Paenibacillus assamensis]|uniref:acyl carrier protein n=1 Tax=Paenibacillus assamensis TaxID=311244 RepID=UPI00048CD21C|nr:phosphopantetheine-binding protein [Paenibacillus assamensis]
MNELISREELSIKITRLVGDILEITEEDHAILYDDDLTVLGLDSVKSVRLVLVLEEIFNVIFNDDELLFESFNTINKIIDRVSCRLA